MRLLPILLLAAALAAPAAAQPAKPDKAEVAPEALPARGARKLAAAKPDLGRIGLGETVRGTFDPADPRMSDGSYFDVWLYTGRAGEVLQAELASDALDVFLLFGRGQGSGFERLASDDDGGGGTNARLVVTLPESGTYAFVANAFYPGETGPYVLRVSPADAAPSAPSNPSRGDYGRGARPIAPGTPVTSALDPTDGQLGDGSYFEAWRFSGRAGEVVRVRLTSEVFDTYLLVVPDAPSAEPLARNDDGGGGTNAYLEVELPATGDYLVLANSYEGGATGPYTLTLDTGRAVPTPDALRSADATWDRRYPGGGDPEGQYALLVGIDDYPGLGNDLPSSVADAYIVKRLLVERYGFPDEHVVVLTDAEATREHILNAFARHLGQAGPDGVAVFYYSGHGTQMDGNFGADDAEDDARDEALMVWGEGEASTAILDDEIGVLTQSLAAERVLVAIDACHAGTGTRGEAVQGKRVRLRDAEHFVRPESFLPGSVSAGDGDSALGDVLGQPRDHVLLAASAAHELALPGTGWPRQGGVASVFTYFLAETIEADPDATLAEVMERTRQKTVAYSQATRGRAQTPQLEGEARAVSLRDYLGRR